MKAFTERNPKVVGVTAVAVMAVCILAILFLNRSLFSSGYTIDARFPNAAGISKGTVVMVAGVNAGTVTAVTVHGNAVDAQLSVDNSVVLPHVTTAAVEVETLLGVVDVTLKPVSGWADPLKPGALITDTSVPTEFYQLQNTAHSLLSKTNAQALNNLVTSLADITKDKQTQVAQIIAGLGALTTTVDQRSGQVSSLIDSANTLSSALAARDQQLLSVVNNLDTVSTGLAAHNQDLSNLITNVDAMASQTNSLVNQDSPALTSLLKSLHADLGVVGQHQLDLAQGVSYLGGALKGFQSIAYSGSTPVNWGNIFVNPASLTNTFGIIGPCGTLDQVLNQVLGPDPSSCSAQTGPLPGQGSNPEPAASPSAGSAAHATSQPSSSGRRRHDHAAVGRRGRPRGPQLGSGRPFAVAQPVAAGDQVMGALRAVLASKALRFALAGVVIVAGAVVAVEVTKGTPTYPVNVVYTSAPGLFTGAAVDVLGVKVGTVTGVQNMGDKVHVTLAVDQGTKIPASAFASLVAPQVLGSPDVDLNPGYTGGPYLPSGATIAQDHTAVPVSTDEVLKELQHTLDALDPHAVGNLVSNLASDLNGQGASLNKLIASAAGTVQLLADKGNDLGKLNGTLAQLTGTLDADTGQIEHLIAQYDTVSTTVAQHSGQLNDAITQLAGASSNLVSLLVPNIQPLEADVGTVTTAGRTLDRNLASVDAILQNGNSLFQGAKRAYDPNVQLAEPEPPDGTRRDRRLHRRTAARPVGGHLPAHRDQPRLGPLGVRRRHAHPVRQPLLGLLRPAAQRHPDHPRHAGRRGRVDHGPGAAPEGPRPDRARRAGHRQRGRRGTVTAGAAGPGRGADHHDDDGANAEHHDDHGPVRAARRHPRLPQGLERLAAARAPPRARARRRAGWAGCSPTRSPRRRGARPGRRPRWPSPRRPRRRPTRTRR